LAGDVLAGLAVAAVAIPTAMGYSAVALVPVQVGHYALPAVLIIAPGG
jgi:MFS superfamily sulfate permease-like transporter